jgi:hypothetical protein
VDVPKLRDKPGAIANIVIKVALLPETFTSGEVPLFLAGIDRDLCLQQLHRFGDCSR